MLKVEELLHLKNDLKAMRNKRLKRLRVAMERYGARQKDITKIHLEKLLKKLFHILDQHLTGDENKSSDSDSCD
jgi:hypothetical protein